MKDMRIGWNLGNTFDAPEGETAWGMPMTSQAMIEKLKELGFQTIRIPISWHKHVSPAPEYTINESFLNRVDTVVNWALDAGMYVIINSHHDNVVYYPSADNAQRGKEFLTAVWTQLGEHYKDASYKLIFQTMNEPRLEGTSFEWYIDPKNDKCLEAIEVVNQLNQTALDAIRATGGNNADRFVIVSPYCGSPDSTLISQYRLPTDSVEGKLIQSIHAYTPYNFALNQNKADAVSTYTQTHRAEIKGKLKAVNYKFSKLGVSVIVDEMGCVNRDNPEDRYNWSKDFVSIAADYGMPCVWWDNLIVEGNGELFGLLNRRKVEVWPQSQRAYEGLMEGVKAWDAETEDEKPGKK